MKESEKTFRDELLNVEKLNSAYKMKYEKEIQAMIEKKLTLFGKLIYVLAGVTALVFGLSWGAIAILGLMERPVSTQIISLVLAGILLGFAGLAGYIVKSGALKLKVHPPIIAGMLWAFIVVMLIGIMGKGIRQTEPIWTIQAVVYGIVFLIVSSLLMILNRMQQSEYKTREKLLEIEYRIAELSEKAADKSDK